ncbi:hypothetical protein BLOT_009205 [Blomia tropicalis]|nr:hypothetical protein BLOT_009205 [Blomia tropicalis]
MSENATAVSVPAADTKPQNDVKTDDGKMDTNNVANDSKMDISNDLKMDSTTPGGRQRRKRTSDVAELIIQTPAGADSNRRQTRSQTRGTPAPAPPAPTPAKKPALEKPASNGSAKGRRGRPPKSATENEKSVAEEEEEVSKEKPASKDKTESKPESKPETKSEDVKTVEKKESAEKKDSSVNSTLVKDKPAPVAASPVKVVATPIIKKVEEESKPEPKVENSHEEKPKENVVAPISVVEKEKPSTVTEISNEGDKVDKVTTDVEKKVVNSPPDSLTVNNHEQQLPPPNLNENSQPNGIRKD